MKIQKVTTAEEELEITGATLLSAEEAVDLPKRLKYYTNWWWLRTLGNYQYTATYVSTHGSANYHCGDVNCDDGAVRPALKISNFNSSNLKIGDKFLFGDKVFEIISESMAFCLNDIGWNRFNPIHRGNNYEDSEIKEFVDKWFEKAKKEISH